LKRARALALAAVCAAVVGPGAGRAEAPDAASVATARRMICQTIEDAAAANSLPAGFLARLLWTESGFSSAATSPAGAEGVAQFMPQTAAERGLTNPRDPEQAIGHAARLLVELDRQFGNLGLAAAAYNAGAARIAKWLQATARLPGETRNYVLAVTGRPIEEWAAGENGAAATAAATPGASCLSVIASLTPPRHGPLAPLPLWQVRLGSDLSKAIALLASNNNKVQSNTRPVAARDAAESLCDSIRARGAACQVYGR